jgi:cytochrome c peroxidase
LSYDSKLLLGCLLAVGCEPADLLTESEQVALQELVMDPAAIPDSPSNAYADDPTAIELGKFWYYDLRFSGPLTFDSDLGKKGEMDKVGCITCHYVETGAADKRSGQPLSLGAGKSTRNAQTTFNVGFMEGDRWISWDGRNDSLWAQAAGSRESSSSHNGTRLKVAHTIFAYYRAEYEALFGPMPDMSDATRFLPADQVCDAVEEMKCKGKPGDDTWEAMSAEDQLAVTQINVNVAKAVAAYERQLITPDTPFDLFMRGEGELAVDAVRGAKLFVGKASCNECHRGPIMTDGKFHNLGVRQVYTIDTGREGGIESVLALEWNGASQWSDEGAAPHLEGLAPVETDYLAFKTPTLRNVALTAPYMHNGSIGSLWDVLEFYRFGGRDDGAGVHDVAIQPLDLSDEEIHDIIAFLNSLSALPAEDLITPPVLP